MSKYPNNALGTQGSHKGDDRHWVNVFARATRRWWRFLYFDGFGVKNFIHATVFRGEYHLTQACK